MVSSCTLTMPSFSHPIFISTTSITPPTNHNPLLFHLPPLNTRRSFRHPTSKTAVRNHKNDHLNLDNHILLDRRNMLINSGLAGIYGGATILGGGAVASPIGPEVKDCGLTTTAGNGPEGLECCPPSYDTLKLVDFKSSNYPNPKLRLRRPAHLAGNDPEYMAKFEEAVRRMKALDRRDPRNFTQQALIHCAYCDGSYHLNDNKNIKFLVHGNSVFLPFHRVYLYFFERILGKLIEDPSFALPYWNWDNPDGMSIPAVYTNMDSPLFDILRDRAHQPPAVADLNYRGTDSNISKMKQINDNLLAVKTSVENSKTPDSFMGTPLTATTGGAGSIETLHNSLHIWVGDRTDKPFNRNMGRFFSAANDPVFYCHHANVDRMWHIWNTELGNKNFSSSDWNESYFILYDENKQAVRIRVEDCLNINQLGYMYEDQPLPWRDQLLKGVPKPKKVNQASARMANEEFQTQTLDKVLRTRVTRPKKEKQDAEEVLNISLTIKSEDEYIKFDVYVNDGQEFETDSPTEIGRSYVGSFTYIPHKPVPGKMYNMNRVVQLPLTSVLEDLGDDGDAYVDVAIVPKCAIGSVDITQVTVGFLG